MNIKTATAERNAFLVVNFILGRIVDQATSHAVRPIHHVLLVLFRDLNDQTVSGDSDHIVHDAVGHGEVEQLILHILNHVIETRLIK